MLAEYFCVGNLREGLYKDIACWFLYMAELVFIYHIFSILLRVQVHIVVLNIAAIL